MLQALGLLFQIGAVIAFVRIVGAAIQFEDPFHHIIKEVAVMGDHQHRSGIFLEVVFQPLDAFGIKVVGRFIEQQDVGLLDQQPGECNAAFFTA